MVRGDQPIEDHKPDHPPEKARIEAQGGRVFAIDYGDGEEGPARVWLADADLPGLAMARSVRTAARAGGRVGRVRGGTGLGGCTQRAW